MQSKTKTVRIVSIGLFWLSTLLLAGCTSTTQEQTETSYRDKPAVIKEEVKNVSLMRQGIAFTILDNNISHDTTGVIVSGNVTKVSNDTLTMQTKSATQSIDQYFVTLNKKKAKTCTYAVQPQDDVNSYKVYELSLSTTCKETLPSKLLYIYNIETPEKVIKIEQSNKYTSPRCDEAKTKYRFECISFL